MHRYIVWLFIVCDNIMQNNSLTYCVQNTTHNYMKNIGLTLSPPVVDNHTNLYSTFALLLVYKTLHHMETEYTKMITDV